MKSHERRAIRRAVEKLLSDNTPARPYSIARQAVNLAQVRAGRGYDYILQLEALEYARYLMSKL